MGWSAPLEGQTLPVKSLFDRFNCNPFQQGIQINAFLVFTKGVMALMLQFSALNVTLIASRLELARLDIQLAEAE